MAKLPPVMRADEFDALLNLMRAFAADAANAADHPNDRPRRQRERMELAVAETLAREALTEEKDA